MERPIQCLYPLELHCSGVKEIQNQELNAEAREFQPKGERPLMLQQIFKEHSNMKKKMTFELDFLFDIFQIQTGGVCGQFAYICVLRRRVNRSNHKGHEMERTFLPRMTLR